MPDHVATLYDTYKSDPSPENLHGVVHALRPTIDYALASLQSGDNPVLRAKAKVLAAKAIQSYDPQYGAALPTWVSGQLMPLRRMRRASMTVTNVPERIQLDAYTLFKAEQNFQDQRGREPDMQELADFSKLPIKRITTIRNTMKSTPSESAIGDAAPPQEADFTGEAMDYVHHDADHVDRRILELKTGYGGHDMMEPKEVALKLGLSPTQLTRRSQRLTFKINEIERRLRDLQQ